MIAIIDYGMGNLRSVQKALEHIGATAQITHSIDDISGAEKIILPGVGAMRPAIDKLNELGLTDCIVQNVKDGKPFLGICLGLQLLFETSDEGGDVKGLGLIKGKVQRFTSLKVPHMGWNQLQIQSDSCPLFKGVDEGTDAYFCHSYYVCPDESQVSATMTDYGVSFTSAIHSNNIYGVQFHPEKSQQIGLNILKNFAEI